MKDATKCQHLVCHVSSFKRQTTKYLNSKVLVSIGCARPASPELGRLLRDGSGVSQRSWQVHAYRGDATNQAALRHEKVLAIAGATETHTCNIRLIRET